MIILILKKNFLRKYDEAVRDKVVLDLMYEAREIEQNVVGQDKIDEWFEAKTRGLSEVARAKLKQRWETMKLLIVVNKLLTGFDAPPATYLYIDKTLKDHGLFQAICRVNRLDGEDKEFGYIIDYKDLFRSLEKAINDYSSEAFDLDELQENMPKREQLYDLSAKALRAFSEVSGELQESSGHCAYSRVLTLFEGKSLVELLVDIGIDVIKEMSAGTKEEKVPEILRENPAAVYLEIAIRLKISRMTVSQKIKCLKDEEVIVRVGPAKKGYWKCI